MTSMQRAVVVFSDLDGTLLDSETYSFEAARPTLATLKQRGVPLVLATSKTEAELAELRREMQHSAPFICENGGSIHVPASLSADQPELQSTTLGVAYLDILDTLAELRASCGFSFRGFADMSNAELSDVCGLSLEAAALARRRQSSEPILWEGDEEALEDFRYQLEARGLRLLRGGRFWHVQGDHDKGNGVAFLIEAYTKAGGGQRPLVIAAGDAPNDNGMLNLADVAIALTSRDQSRPAPHQAGVVLTPQQHGPAGFAAGIEEAFKVLSSQL